MSFVLFCVCFFFLQSFGREVLLSLGVPSEDLETVFQRVYTEFVEGVDGEGLLDCFS
jgi:uncharacterized UPF0160 family protein